ncbi:MAG: hypothetical protein GY759_02985 [Chloroflexi bacterium]|nr:hypothetical protein [Chloroflexota bacterium]
MDSYYSLFDRIISRPRSLWLTLGITLLLVLAPLAAAYADGVLSELLSNGSWRAFLVPSIVIIYILLVAPRLAHTEDRIYNSIRPILLIDDKAFEQLVEKDTYISLRTELLAFVAGAVLGLLLVTTNSDLSISWLMLVMTITSACMYGLLFWTISVSVAGAKLNNTLLRQPMKIDPFDITPFEAIGRQSLLIALIFIGGITLSLVMIGFRPGVLLRPETWVVYVPMLLVPFVIFFFSMYPTHRVLAIAKFDEIVAVQGHLQRRFRGLLQCLDEQTDTTNLSAEINALVAYEDQLQSARTWPYNTRMLRTLFFSVLIPASAVAGRAIVSIMFS